MNRRNLIKATMTRALIQLGSCLCEFYWIYICKRIANADTQNIRIANADGRDFVFNLNLVCKLLFLAKLGAITLFIVYITSILKLCLYLHY